VHNHHGGFRLEFVDRYIREVLKRGKITDGRLLKEEFGTHSTD
jgi:hypothetical protein